MAQRGMKQMRLWERELRAMAQRKRVVSEGVLDAMADFLSDEKDIEIQLSFTGDDARPENRKGAIKRLLKDANSQTIV